MKLALAQYPITQHTSIEAWRLHVRDWVLKAVFEKANVLVFPEYGSLELVSFFSSEIQKSLSLQIIEMQKYLKSFTEHYQNLAKEFNVAILAPSIPVQDPRFQKPVNRAFFFFPDGRIEHQDKTYMTRFENESWGIGPGEKNQKTFEAFGCRFGVNICFDVEFPFSAMELAKNGVQVLLAPSCTETLNGMNRVHIGARARALENQFYVAVSQTVGTASWSEAVDINTGQAALYSTCDIGFPDDGTLISGKINEPVWIYFEPDLSLIEKVRTEGQVFNFKNMSLQQNAKPLHIDDKHSHTILKDGRKHTWFAKRLWSLSAGLPEFDYEVALFNGFDEDFWFGDRIKPTINKVIEHSEKIQHADYNYPIILSEDGKIMDGVHRIIRAHLEGRKTIRAVRFEKNPEPDIINMIGVL